MTRRRLLVPAVHQDGSREGRVDRLHLLQELEHSDGREGNSEVGPAGEVELRDQSGSFAAAVTGLLNDQTQKDHQPHTDILSLIECLFFYGCVYYLSFYGVCTVLCVL